MHGLPYPPLPRLPAAFSPPPNPCSSAATQFVLSIESLLNDHPPKEESAYAYCREPLMGYPIDPGPSNPYDPGPAPDLHSPDNDQTQRNRPKKVIPFALLNQMSRAELERYNSLNYSKQEGYVAQLLVRARNFSVEDSEAWNHMLRINDGKAPTSIQIRRFLQFLEAQLHIKVPRPEKRYRTNGIMWIDRNWDIVQNFIHILPQIPKDASAAMADLD
jgi:hypothetical protein